MLEIRKRLWDRYVPKAFAVREEYEAALAAKKPGDPEPTPKFAVEIHCLDAGEARAYQKRIVLKTRKDGTIDLPNAQQIDEEIFARNVRCLEPHAVITDEDNGAKTALSTPELLWKLGPPELVRELQEAIADISVLEAGRRDGSSSQSGGSPRATTP